MTDSVKSVTLAILEQKITVPELPKALLQTDYPFKIF
jgi:hypothetical protein